MVAGPRADPPSPKFGGRRGNVHSAPRGNNDSHPHDDTPESCGARHGEASRKVPVRNSDAYSPAPRVLPPIEAHGRPRLRPAPFTNTDPRSRQRRYPLSAVPPAPPTKQSTSVRLSYLLRLCDPATIPCFWTHLPRKHTTVTPLTAPILIPRLPLWVETGRQDYW